MVKRADLAAAAGKKSQSVEKRGMAIRIPVHKAPVVDPQEAEALYRNNMTALATVVQAIVFESYPDPTSEVHEAVRQQSMRFADALRRLIHRWITLFVAPVQAPALRGRPKEKEEIDAEHDALNATVAGVDAHFTDAPMPESEELRQRALDLAASAMMFHFGVPSDSLLVQQMTKVTMWYLAGPHDIPLWKTALQSQFDLGSLWMRDRKKLTSREIAISICARVAAVPGAPDSFRAPTADQLDALVTVIDRHVRVGNKAFRLPRVNKKAAGRGSGRTTSSWEMAAEFGDVLDKPMGRARDAKRRPRNERVRKTK
jgi:hypothetical protein